MRLTQKLNIIRFENKIPNNYGTEYEIPELQIVEITPTINPNYIKHIPEIENFNIQYDKLPKIKPQITPNKKPN